MSISTPRVKNPSTKFIEFSSDKKQFYYFDKDKGEKGTKVVLETPLFFVVCDVLNCITGFNDDHQCGIYSNEVHSVKKEILEVRLFKGKETAVGLYEDIKGDIASLGGKFAKSIYALWVTGKSPNYQYELVNIKLSGAAMSAYIDFKFDPSTQLLAITGEYEEKKKGKTEYNVPIFKTYKITEEALQEAIKVDSETLQPYFASKKVHVAEDVQYEDKVPENATEVPKNETVRDEHGIPEPDNELPF